MVLDLWKFYKKHQKLKYFHIIFAKENIIEINIYIFNYILKITIPTIFNIKFLKLFFTLHFYILYKHSFKKSCEQHLLFSRKIALTTIAMLGISMFYSGVNLNLN